MKSIRNKLVLGILLINSLMLIGIIIFKFSFEGFYIKNMSKDLNEFANKLMELIDENRLDEFSDYIVRYGESENISIDIYNEDNRLVFTNQNTRMNNNHKYGKYGPINNNKEQIIQKHYCGNGLESYVIQNNMKGIEFLAIESNGKNDNYSVICKTPITAIKSSVDKATKFLFIIFLPIIVISVFVAIEFSKKFTKPIIKLTEVSNSISSLNFDEKVEIHTNDEIEILANSINTLSSKINESMESLKVKNKELEILIENKLKQEKLRREFVSSVSHELKTPITVISGYAHGLKSNVVEDEEDKAYYLDVICEESEKMCSMVNELLDLYKLESKVFNIQKEAINFRELIEKVAKKHSLIIEDRNISMTVDLEEACVLGDKLRLEQVINNLLDNAINHTSGKIIVKTEVIDEGLKLSIINSGNKINESDLEKIWYSFIRLDKIRNSSENRLGLGLSIVREIIKLHDGSYGVENVKDGVEFWISIRKI